VTSPQGPTIALIGIDPVAGAPVAGGAAVIELRQLALQPQVLEMGNGLTQCQTLFIGAEVGPEHLFHDFPGAASGGIDHVEDVCQTPLVVGQ
jgi:hypothetical protein